MRVTTALLAAVVSAATLAANANGGSCYGCVSRTEKQQMQDMIYQKFGRGWRGRTAVCIANAESGLNPSARSRTGDHGLFQINYQAHKGWVDFSRIYDPAYNLTVAYRLSGAGTRWGPWTTAWKCT